MFLWILQTQLWNVLQISPFYVLQQFLLVAQQQLEQFQMLNSNIKIDS